MNPLTVPTVAVPDLGDDLLLDVREDGEWAAGRAPGAVHIPMSRLQSRLDEVPSDRPVAVICKSGHRSAQCAAFLIAQGRQARNVDGGMSSWAALGLPMEADGDAEPWIA